MSPSTRYAVLMAGVLNRLDVAGCTSREDLLVYFGIVTSEARRFIAGLVQMGPDGLAESIGISGAKTRRSITRLETAGLLLSDFSREARPGLLYVVRAATEDAPTTPTAVKAAARQYAEYPHTSKVMVAVRADLDAAISRVKPKDATNANPDRLSLYEQWEKLVAADAPSERASESSSEHASEGSSEGVSEGLLPYPSPLSVSVDPDPAAAARYQRAWDHCLQQPPFAAAAAADFIKAVKEFPEETWNGIILELACSVWVIKPGKLNRPALRLRELFNSEGNPRSAGSEHLMKLLAGEYREQPLQSWRCPACSAHHQPLDDCPPVCRGCNRCHSLSDYCLKLRDLEERERAIEHPATPDFGSMRAAINARNLQ